jgi:hypothetical protein
MTTPRQSALEAVAAAARRYRATSFTTAREELDEALAALDALGPADTADGWRTIDIAPDDGKPIYVFGGRYENVTVLQTDGEWWRHRKAVGSTTVPTHWHPYNVPAPPQRAQEGAALDAGDTA